MPRFTCLSPWGRGRRGPCDGGPAGSLEECGFSPLTQKGDTALGGTLPALTVSHFFHHPRSPSKAAVTLWFRGVTAEPVLGERADPELGRRE